MDSVHRFFQQFWKSIRSDVCSMIMRFFETGVMENGINHTNICLIPKFLEVASMGDYRPISLCTIAYKLIN